MTHSQRLKILTSTSETVSQAYGKARRPRIAVIIPAYNEEKNIEKVLMEIAALRETRPDWEITPIIVNDGSTDQTEKVLRAIAPQYSAKVISLPVNLGIGRAVQAGFRFASQMGVDVALQLDGDGQHPAQQIPNIVEPVLSGQAEVVIGSRYVRGAGGNVSSSLRQVGTIFFSKLLQFLVGVKIQDTTSGFRAFNSDATDFISRHYSDDYPEVQAYVPLTRRKFSITEVPVTMRVRQGGKSSITPLRSIYYMVKVAFATSIDVIRPLPARRTTGK
jgi:glycosyltransferase involved in cell wall biosynthesis